MVLRRNRAEERKLPKAPAKATSKRPQRNRHRPRRTMGLRLASAGPALTVNDIQKSLAWYRDVLGFTVGERWERWQADGRRAVRGQRDVHDRTGRLEKRARPCQGRRRRLYSPPHPQQPPPPPATHRAARRPPRRPNNQPPAPPGQPRAPPTKTTTPTRRRKKKKRGGLPPGGRGHKTTRSFLVC